MKAPGDSINVIVLQTMVSGIPLVLGLEPERRLFMVFWGPVKFWTLFALPSTIHTGPSAWGQTLRARLSSSSYRNPSGGGVDRSPR